MGIDLRGLLTLLSGKTVVIAAEQAHSGPLSSVLLARRGTFYPLICLCDKDNVPSVNLDLEDVGFVFLFPLINQADLKCGNTSCTDVLGVFIYIFILTLTRIDDCWVLNADSSCFWTAVYNNNYWKLNYSKTMMNNVKAPPAFQTSQFAPWWSAAERHTRLPLNN